MEKNCKIIINNKRVSVKVKTTDRLIDVLREELHLTGTKEGCGEGECGACSVILNGELVNSCLVIMGQLEDGDKITTIEGVAKKGKLVPLQESFLNNGGVQCGFCTPGIILAAHVLLSKNPDPTREEIAAAIAGNLCRCTGYTKIIDAIEKCSIRGKK